LRPVLLHHLHKVQASSAASRSLIAVRRQDLRAAISNAPPVWVALRASSQAARVPSIPRALDLQDLAAPEHPVDVPDSAHAPALALRVPAVLAAHAPVQAALRQQARRLARSAHRRIALAAAASSIRKRRKAR
jgi:hypothetical protein